MSLDLAQRSNSIPFMGQIIGYNRSEFSDANVSQAATLGDFYNLAGTVYGGTPSTDNMVRFLKPHQGTILQAYLSVALIFSSLDTANTLRLSISKTTSNSNLVAVVPTSAQIDATMLALFGSKAGLTANAASALTVDAVNIAQLLPQPASADYRDEAIVLGVHFKTAPLQGNGYSFNKFKLDLRAQIVS